MKIKLTKEECYCGIKEFYNNIAKRLGYDPLYVAYDCTKIYVSNKIFTRIYEFYRNKYSIGMDQMGMKWLMFGPKCDYSLNGFAIIVKDGFIEEV